MTDYSVSQQSYLKKQKRYRQTVRISQFAILILFLTIWELTSYFDLINSFIFSSPSKIFLCFVDMLLNNALLQHICITILETMISFLLITALGLFTAIMLWLNPYVAKTLEPYLVVLNSLPKSALAPLLIVWLGANLTTIIVVGISIAIFGTILNLYTCFQEVDPDSIKLIKTLGGNKRAILFKVVIPSTLPTTISLMKVNVGLALVGVVIGEFLAARQGLGYLIIYGSQVFKMDWVLMSILILCVIAMVLYALISWIEKKISFQ